MGKSFWSPLVDYLRDALLAAGTIDEADVTRWLVTDSPEEAIDTIRERAMKQFGLTYGPRSKRRWWLGESERGASTACQSLWRQGRVDLVATSRRRSVRPVASRGPVAVHAYRERSTPESGVPRPSATTPPSSCGTELESGTRSYQYQFAPPALSAWVFR
jgi:hypothetical protein